MEKEIREKIKPGAKIRVYDESGRFEGIILSVKHGDEAGASFTIRGNVADVGVEKVFPFNSPAIKKIEIMSSPEKVKRSKIYYIRDLSKKKTRRKIGVSL
ncbi:MAG: 50S ribosomal protein L19 [Candidatus Liptonbacteria bacterium CG11_big_fil_rev_8_21_14_0_20_35_14]|uniref:Large ribosomal subunit protein bL19 n=1 Tax=Candidatus Liptonbacteria bacterium CG11_big_fil_rev_8_21_14_0_20_35_14 TaxID=1974634 RepID=A0A2H0NAN8_9BACT|nr:MAG: 50S ribosomal protein L19 [Candidatus Liptonbacteria bacterium CG11_big_fil_rev_8_21_14_0_20_35_14]